MEQTRIRKGTELGSRAVWGQVGYAGTEFAPACGTYALMSYFTRQDSGGRPPGRAPLANLTPLVAAALYETGFAWEAGPLSTWNN